MVSNYSYIVKFGTHYGLVGHYQILCREAHLNPAKALMTFRALNGTAHVKAKRVLGDPCDAQDFRASIKRNHLVNNLHLRVEPGLGAIRLTECSALLGSNFNLIPVGPSHYKKQFGYA